MTFRASLSSTPAFHGRNRKAMSTRRLGFREGEGGMNEGGRNGGAVGGKEGGGEGEAVAARRTRFARPAAVLRFVRQAVERGVSKSSKGTRARVAAWRRRMSVALIGVAAAVMMMTASAGPAQALFGIGGRKEAPVTRLTYMPESIYQEREELQKFCETPQQDRLFDSNDMTAFEEELDGIDMFSNKVAPSYGARESFRLKYARHVEDFIAMDEGKLATGSFGVASFALIGGLAVVVGGTVLGGFTWACRAFINMAREEEIFLYGEEISVDATEKPDEELDDLDEDFDLDDDDMEDYSAPGSASGAGGNPPPPSTPPSGSGGDGDAGGADSSGDDLLGM
ncbi:expressed unknown protein [Ectocarpus siliculosus]|uniref:Uncharacterized protein n=1 Tax=Ectocarpus siliculosus TaxID=2880 RepID=D7FYH5_ECTSI|nr:expressed unknown protein [Ectocarpus siliculosus]|eukprot:CBJ32517.1 expressed unknown protein [Ectocarpus siliculosus]